MTQKEKLTALYHKGDKQKNNMEKREIKFRAFENENARGRMFEWAEIKKEFGDYLNCRDTFVMQYTGLKDKNGKGIFEGDFLKNTKGEIGIVKWIDAGFYLEAKRKNNTVLHIPLQPGFLLNKEIIGNVFESPELLKETNNI